MTDLRRDTCRITIGWALSLSLLSSSWLLTDSPICGQVDYDRSSQLSYIDWFLINIIHLIPFQHHYDRSESENIMDETRIEARIWSRLHQSFRSTPTETEEKNKFKFEWDNCCKEVVSNAPCVICTDSTAGLKVLRSQVGGSNPKGIIIMRDEAGMEVEARTWVPITKLKMAHQVVGIVMVGDRNQLGPLQLSKGANFNKFGLQSSYSL